jgi:Type IV secretory pathway, VirB10 components
MDLFQWLSGSSSSSPRDQDSTGSSDENAPDETSGESASGDTNTTTDSQRGDFLSAFERFLSDTFGQSGPSEPSNEQPTNYNPLVISGVVIALFLLIMTVYLWPSSEGDPQSQSSQTAQQQQQSQQSVPDREGTPGMPQERGDPVTDAFTNESNSGQSEDNRSTPPPPDRQKPDADPSNVDKYLNELAEQQKRNNNRPPGATGRQGNPYQSQDVPQAAQGGQQSESFQKAKSSEMSIDTEPPGNFDPNKEGVPRNPASGRPVGSAPTPAETRKEANYQRDQQASQQEETEPREVLQERFPTGPGGGLNENEKFLARQEIQGRSADRVNSVKGPFESFVIPKGTIIPVVLESGAQNKLPGVTKMRVSRDVYDRTMRHILIPKGSEIVSQYSTGTQVGQNRVLVSANRLNLPDGRYVNFSDARAAGPEGYAGLSDLKDRHLLERFGAAGGLAVLGAVVNASNPLSFLGAAQQDSTRRGAGVVAGGGFRGRFSTTLSEQVNQIVGQLLQKQIDRQPTLELRPGLSGLLIINEDIDLKRPYYEPGGDLQRQDRQHQEYLRKRRQRQMQRAIRRVQEMTQDRRRTQQLRNQARQTVQQSGRSGPTSSRRSTRRRPPGALLHRSNRILSITWTS